MVESEIKRRGRPSAGVTAQRQAQLLVAARKIFVRSGYRAARMDEVASAGGITKRTLYAWHKDKEALFRACVLEGALRFPRLEMRGDETLAASLERFVIELHGELSREESYRIGLLIMREAGEFPELADTSHRAYMDYLIHPLAEVMRTYGLERPLSVESSFLFVNMALSPLHNTMLLRVPLPSSQEVVAHAKLCVAIFLNGRADRAQKG